MAKRRRDEEPESYTASAVEAITDQYRRMFDTEAAWSQWQAQQNIQNEAQMKLQQLKNDAEMAMLMYQQGEIGKRELETLYSLNARNAETVRGYVRQAEIEAQARIQEQALRAEAELEKTRMIEGKKLPPEEEAYRTALGTGTAKAELETAERQRQNEISRSRFIAATGMEPLNPNFEQQYSRWDLAEKTGQFPTATGIVDVASQRLGQPGFTSYEQTPVRRRNNLSPATATPAQTVNQFRPPTSRNNPVSQPK